MYISTSTIRWFSSLLTALFLQKKRLCVSESTLEHTGCFSQMRISIKSEVLVRFVNQAAFFSVSLYPSYEEGSEPQMKAATLLHNFFPIPIF